MEIKARGRMRVILNAADISKAVEQYRHKHSATDCVLNYAMDAVMGFGDSSPRHISHKINMPDKAIVNFRLGGRD